jgi:anhydro-N-acetylmuramic acid kinase
MRTIVGTMTGTSMDGVDAVAVTINGEGLAMTASFVGMASCNLGDLSPMLRALALGGGSKQDMHAASEQLGKITARAIKQLQLASIDMIALHGQTIFHDPPISVQLINPQPVIDQFPCTVLTDPRQADLQLGGQGAPITPLADWIMFRHETMNTAIINLGGFCNVTVLPASCEPNQVFGFDVCCCNLVLNAIARERLDAEFDIDGNAASQGKIDDAVCTFLFEYLSEQAQAQRSLGTNDDLGRFVLQLGKHLSTEDLLASAIKAISACIAGSNDADRILLAGGGVHNRQLVSNIPNSGTTQILGVPTQAREGMAMAILAALAQDGVSITLPQITGRRKTTDVVGWVQASP